MNTNSPLQFAEEYARADTAPLAVLPESKILACDWFNFQTVPPTPEERRAMFSISEHVNVALTCGIPSGNLFGVDCETQTSFEDALEALDRVGLADTWIDETPRGGRIWLRASMPLQSQKKKGGEIEVLGQSKYGLTYPSRVARKEYRRLHHPPAILEIPSLETLREALPWFEAKEAEIPTRRVIPRKASRLLRGKGVHRYSSRSEAEQAAIDSLFSAGFDFSQVLALFRKYPAGGKFASLTEDHAIAYLRCSYEKARRFYETESPHRMLARDSFLWAASIPWPGRTGSTDRSAFFAHCNFAFISGRESYAASVRDIAEHAGCERSTAQKATRRLRNQGLIELTKPFSYSLANRYSLTTERQKEHSFHHSYKTNCEGVDQTVPFSKSALHDAFRRKALGRSACEVLDALSGPLSAQMIAIRTGRHIRTVRLNLKKLKAVGLVKREKGEWFRSEQSPDLNEIANAMGTAGTAARQKRRHRAERLARQITDRIQRAQQRDPAQ